MPGEAGAMLVSVLDAGSEMEALAIQAFLEEQGIEAAVRSRQIPMYDGIARVWNPVWGNVLVLDAVAGRARDLIEEYLDALRADSRGGGEGE